MLRGGRFRIVAGAPCHTPPPDEQGGQDETGDIGAAATPQVAQVSSINFTTNEILQIRYEKYIEWQSMFTGCGCRIVTKSPVEHEYRPTAACR